MTLAAAVVLGGCADAGDDRAAHATALMEEALSDDLAGCSMAAAHEGEVLWAHAIGLADDTTARQMDTSTRFNLGSIGKQFTATALLTLVDSGDVALDDPVSEHLPELPAWADEVTVEQLMHHTSGLRDRPYARGEKVTRSMRLDDLASTEGMHQDTTAFHYANINYVALSEIVARVTGEEFTVWTSENLFGEADADFEITPSASGDDIAVGHDDLDPRLPAEDTADWTGAGDVIGTPSELAVWADQYRDPQVILPDTLAAAIAAAVPAEEGFAYGPGIWIWDDGSVGHDGRDVGITSAFRIDPASGVALAGACNTSPFDPGDLWDGLADVWLGAGPATPSAR